MKISLGCIQDPYPQGLSAFGKHLSFTIRHRILEHETGTAVHRRTLSSGKEREDPVMTYKRMTGLTQEQFCDEIFDACRHFINWDFHGYGKRHALMPINIPAN